MTRPRIIIADDHRMLVESLCAILGRDYEMVDTAFDGPSLLSLVEHCQADCLLLDLVLPGQNGLELIPRVKVLRPSIVTLVATMLLDRALAGAALDAGAHGYITKDAGIDELKHAIGEVLAGRRYIYSRIPKTTQHVSMGARHPALRCLTRRQQEILLLLGEGKSEARIADELRVSPSTITFHKTNLMRALGLESEALLRQYSVLVCPGRP